MNEELKNHEDPGSDTGDPREPVVMLGSLGVDDSEQADIGHAPLPKGYWYDDPKNTTPDEIAVLLKKPGLSEDQIAEAIVQNNKSWQEQGIERLDVVVRAANGQLVAFGSVLHKDGRGELSSLAVSPEHQRRGIGGAIVKERVRMTEEAGIHSLYIPYVEASSGLGEQFYLTPELQFRKTAAGEIVRGPDPASITGIPPKQSPSLFTP